MGQIEKKRRGSAFLAMNLDATTPPEADAAGLGAGGEFDRSMMPERQREGIAKARSEGKYKGEGQ